LNLYGVPQHIVQRGINRADCFFHAVDYRRYLIHLHQFSIKFGCDVHAYALMTNHVHVLVTPNSIGAISRMMHAIGTHYVAYVNRRYDRTGTLWSGRHKASLVDSEQYLLRCYRYIEQNPVRARMVPDMGDYPWSSYRCNALGSFDPIVTPHRLYLGLGATEDTRLAAYRAIATEHLAEQDLEILRVALNQQRPLR
jgi:putative transposase